jgi:hypothetical protein
METEDLRTNISLEGRRMITKKRFSCMFSLLFAACVVACLFSAMPAWAQNQQVDLSSTFNTAGVFSLGTTFQGTNDIDGPASDGCSNGLVCSDAYLAQGVFGATFTASAPTLTPASLGIPFNFGPVNTVDCGPLTSTACTPDIISLPSAPLTITLPSTQQQIYSTMVMLGNGVQGSQPGTITVTYTDSTTNVFNQTFSDWCSFGDNTYESIAVGPINPMRINSDGTAGSCSGNLYAYTYPLDFTRTLQSITLQNPSSSGYSFVWAITLKPPSYTLAGGAATPPSISAGATSTATVTVTPQPGYVGTVTLTCVVSPAIVPTSAATPPTCAASPTQVTLTAGETAPFPTTSLTFTTVVAAKAMAQPSHTMFYAFLLPIPGLALMGFSFGSGSARRRKLLGLLLLAFVLAGLVVTPACVSTVHLGNVGTPPGPYYLTVSGIDANGLTQAGSPVAVTVIVTQ